MRILKDLNDPEEEILSPCNLSDGVVVLAQHRQAFDKPVIRVQAFCERQGLHQYSKGNLGVIPINGRWLQNIMLPNDHQKPDAFLPGGHVDYPPRRRKVRFLYSYFAQ